VLAILVSQTNVGGSWRITIGNGCDATSTTEETLEQALAKAMLIA
jgi:hypothetical protein